jgi:hypothetical protein
MKHITLQWTSHAHEFLTILVTPDFSPMLRAVTGLSTFASYCTWLKPGVNERIPLKFGRAS